ncbi:MAG: hypothetical protein ACK46X_14020, partial [Candidatus Sericytochromatia bacterium]
MIPRLNRSILMLGSLAVLVAGCAANPNGVQVDQYGNPITNAYDTGYGSEYGTTDDYGTDPYAGDTTGGSYDGSTGGSYDDSYSGDDTYTGASPEPSPSGAPTSGVDAGALDDRPVLVATMLEVKETGVMGMGKIIAKVEVENPGNTTLSGKLRVMFTDNGNPTANAQIKRVTLAPKERQTLTFTATAWRLDDAEASVE